MKMNKTISKFIRHWGTTKKRNLSSWVLPDGRLIGGVCFPSHEIMINAVFNGQLIFSEFVSETGIIRCSEEHGLLNLTISRNITAEQRHTIETWKDVKECLVDIVILREDGEHYKCLGVYELEKIDDLCGKVEKFNVGG